MRAEVRCWGLWDAVGGNKTCYYDWRRSDLKDHHGQSIRIEKILCAELPQGLKPRRGSE